MEGLDESAALYQRLSDVEVRVAALEGAMAYVLKGFKPPRPKPPPPESWVRNASPFHALARGEESARLNLEDDE